MIPRADRLSWLEREAQAGPNPYPWVAKLINFHPCPSLLHEQAADANYFRWWESSR